MKTAFADALRSAGPILLDGGLATQLEAQGCDISNALWSASVLQRDPQAIVDASRAFLDAGAEFIATASYQASREGFASVGLASDEADRLMLLSVTLAARARDEFLAENPSRQRAPLIAASLGPYGAMLHDGSEYTGAYAVSPGTLRAFHADRLRLLDDSDADVLALETIPSGTEAEVLAELLREYRTPAWVSFCCRDERSLSDGTAVRESASLFRNHPTVLAVGINCTAPQFVTPLIRELGAVLPDKPIAAYPNSGESYDVAENAWTGHASRGLTVSEWVAAGAKLVGGCCRVGPDQIRAMAEELKEEQ